MNRPFDIPKDPPIDYFPEGAPFPVDTSFIQPEDTIVLPTRPPISDIAQGNKKQVARSFNKLETDIFDTLNDFFEVCARSHIKLGWDYASLLKRPNKNKADVEFKQNAIGPWYKEFRTYKGFREEKLPKSRQTVTAAYLVYLEHAWENGPQLLNAFGLSGSMTLIWAHMLRHRFPYLLDSPVFVMAEIEAGTLPEAPLTLDFALDWKVHFLIKEKPKKKPKKKP